MRSPARRSSGGSTARSTTPAATGCFASARRRWRRSTAPIRPASGLTESDQLSRMARPARRNGRHHSDVRVGVPLAGREPPAAVTARAGARRLPDGQPDRRRDAGSRRCWTGSWCTPARCTRTWPGSASGPGASAHPRHLGAGGLGSVESFLSAYEAAAGTELDRDAFRWWLTVATLRWGVICRFQAERHLSGQTPSVELAAIGRRVSRNRMGRAGSARQGGGPR